MAKTVIVASEVRVRRFQRWLEVMSSRAREIVERECYIIFQTHDPRRIPTGEHSAERFVQVRFAEGGFFIDLPTPALAAAEQRRLVRLKPEYFWVADHPTVWGHTEYIRRFDPLNRFYEYGEEADAAAELDWLVFTLLDTPARTGLTVTAATFCGGEVDWEKDHNFKSPPLAVTVPDAGDPELP
jgi:hypothetical protein